VHQKDNPQKPPSKVKKIREEMKTSLENKKKVIIHSSISALKNNNKVEDGGASGLGVKREQERTKNDEG
jgi:hypothetical protein